MTNPAADVDVQVGTTDGPLTASPTWTTQNQVESLSTARGRGLPYGPFSSGSATFVLDNSDGTLDPLHTSTLRPGRPIRWRANVSGSPVVMFTGVISAVRTSYHYPAGSTVTITAVHPLALLTRYLYVDTVAAARTSVSIGSILDTVGWPSTRRVIGTAGHRGQRTHPAWAASGPAMTIIDELVATEGPLGAFFVTRSGDLRFDSKASLALLSTLTASQMTLSLTEADSLLRHRADASLDEAVLYTRAAVTNTTTGVTLTASDATAAADHGNLTATWAGRYSSDSDAQTDADVLVSMYKDPRTVLSPLTITPVEANAEFAKLAALELRDRITVKHTTPAAQASTADYVVEQINTTIARGRDGHVWTTTLGVSPYARLDALNPQQWMIVGDLDTGRVGTGTVAP